MGVGCGHHHHGELEKKLTWPIAATALILVLELYGGWWSNSLALLSDAAHVFMDLLALLLSWAALTISHRPPNDRKTFGYHRVEIFAAFINGASLFIISLFIFGEAWERIQSPEPVKSTEMLIVAIVGFLVNIGIFFYLKGVGQRDLNIKSALYHVFGDALASAGVIVGGIIIAYTQYYFIDSLISFLIGGIIIRGSLRIIFESSHILLEGVPKEVETDQVVHSIKKIDGVIGIHGIHIWSICSNVYSMSAHVCVEDQPLSEVNDILVEIKKVLNDQFKITNTTIEMETTACGDTSLLRNLNHS